MPYDKSDELGPSGDRRLVKIERGERSRRIVRAIKPIHRGGVSHLRLQMPGDDRPCQRVVRN